MKKIYAFLMMSLGIMSYQRVAAQATTLNESFTGTALPTGWASQNLSSPAGAANWGVNGTSAVGVAQGTAAAFVNYTSVTGTGYHKQLVVYSTIKLKRWCCINVLYSQ